MAATTQTSRRCTSLGGSPNGELTPSEAAHWMATVMDTVAVSVFEMATLPTLSKVPSTG